MYIPREIDSFLTQWKDDSRRKPILLRGVRQCGKTQSVRHLSEQFENYAEVNLEKQPSLHSVFSGDLDVKKIISRLELETLQPIKPGRTLLFIDEIQACPRALTALRYFYEDMPDLHVIAAGSLLEIVLNNKQKTPIEFPVGRVRSIYMYPFSFREYLRGTGQGILSEYLDSLSPDSMENLAHEKLLDTYKTFLIVGGMPEAVADYSQNGSFLHCQNIHRDILFNFRDDIGKYNTSIPADIIRQVFDYSLHHVGVQVKASSAIQGISAYYFEESVKLLRRAGLIYPVKASSCDVLPLGSSKKEANKKLLPFDTGIYLTACGLNANDILTSDVFDQLNKGNVVEMQTGLEMIKYTDPFHDAALFYWYRIGANAEVDYVIQKENTVIPVEVKASGKGSMQSIYGYLDTHPGAPYGIRVSLENFTSYEKIRVYPVYAVNKILS